MPWLQGLDARRRGKEKANKTGQTHEREHGTRKSVRQGPGPLLAPTAGGRMALTDSYQAPGCSKSIIGKHPSLGWIKTITHDKTILFRAKKKITRREMVRYGGKRRGASEIGGSVRSAFVFPFFSFFS